MIFWKLFEALLYVQKTECHTPYYVLLCDLEVSFGRTSVPELNLKKYGLVQNAAAPKRASGTTL